MDVIIDEIRSGVKLMIVLLTLIFFTFCFNVFRMEMKLNKIQNSLDKIVVWDDQ